MFKWVRRAPARQLPDGLRICDVCGEARGTTRAGQVSACYCSGLVCNWCGGRQRRPVSDYVDATGQRWWHVPWFGLQQHRCPPETAATRRGEQWTVLQPDPDVRAYQEAVTRWSLAQVQSHTAGQAWKSRLSGAIRANLE